MRLIELYAKIIKLAKCDNLRNNTITCKCFED